MSRAGRIFLGGSAATLAVAVGCVLGTSLNVTVAPVSGAEAIEEGTPAPVAPTPEPSPTVSMPTQTVEAVPPVPADEVPASPEGEETVIEEPAEEGTTWHAMDEGTLICGPDAKPALDFDSSGWGWWAYCEPALVPSAEGTPMGFLPACEQEDSDNCIWDAAVMGNGQGRSFIAYEGQVYYLER